MNDQSKWQLDAHPPVPSKQRTRVRCRWLGGTVGSTSSEEVDSAPAGDVTFGNPGYESSIGLCVYLESMVSPFSSIEDIVEVRL